MVTIGEMVGGRFEIEALVQAGHQGEVFRASDRETERKVALKVLRFGARAQEVERCLREAETLAGLRHEGIAAYVGHGRTPRGEVYLATEWLEGEALAKRLARKPLSLAETLALARRVAGALAGAHGQGAAHGSLRPSKLFLREGRAEEGTLLDYGMTSANLAERTVTGTGAIVETLRYLAPEQARGERPGASTDVYALGCVLFECLTGGPLYPGEHAAMVLAQILYEAVLELSRLRPDLPETLHALLGRMLAKRPEDRVADGDALIGALARVRVTPEQEQSLPGGPGRQVTSVLASEGQRLVSVALVLGRDVEAGADDRRAPRGPDAELLAELEQGLRPYGARVEGLADGSMIMTLARPFGTAVDQVAQAAQAALALCQHLGACGVRLNEMPGETAAPKAGARASAREWSVALTTERGVQSGAQLMGEAVRRAAGLLQAHAASSVRGATSELQGVTGASAPCSLWLDDLTAWLLDLRFLLKRVGEGWVLERERTGEEEVRLLLGRRTPCVGREQELELLALQLRACAETAEPRGVLVLAAAGMGKTRLRQEFLRAVEAQGEGEVFLGRGDPMRGGGAYGLLGQAVLDRCQLELGPGAIPRPDAEHHRRARFAEEVGRHVPEADRQQVVEFLGEMCGVRFDDERRPQLRAARQDPQLMNDRVTAAWVEFLRAECAAHPVLLVLEDLHWSDRATVRLVEVALRELADERLMVLGLARPDVKEMFPGLWQDPQLLELRLPVLSRRASERLVQEMLGERVTPEVVARIAEQAGGNALFLEELIRATAEGREGQPETLLAILQARFGRLEPGTRRLLEVASLLGETFWRGGVMELLGVGPDGQGKEAQDTERWLRALVGAEVILRRGTSRFAGETEYAFRHALLRDAAYGLLGEAERRAGHRRVAGYLERMGERDLMVLAEHHWLGGDQAQAATYFARGAVQAMEASDLAGTLRCVERCVSCGAAGEVLGMLRATEAWALTWSGNMPAASASGQAALALLPPGSDPWYRAIGPLMLMAGAQGQREVLVGHARAFVAASRAATPSIILESGSAGLFQLCLYGEQALVDEMTEQLHEARARLTESDARARGLYYSAILSRPMQMDGDPWPARGIAAQGLASFAAAGDGRFVGTLRGHLAFLRALLGEDRADVLGEFRAVLSLLEELEQTVLVMGFLGLFAIALASMGEPPYLAEAETLAQRMFTGGAFPGFFTGLGHVALAEVWAERGELLRAEEAVRQALPMFAAGRVGRPLGLGVLSRILLAQGPGRLAEAVAAAEEGLAALQAVGGISLLDVKLHLAAVEAYRAAGDHQAAWQALSLGCRQLERRAAQIPEGAARERFLTGMRDNARLLALKAAL